MHSTHCASPSCRAAGGKSLCRPCRDRLRRELSGLPELYEECAPGLARDFAPLERVSGSRGSAAPVSEPRLRARSAVLSVLASWSDLVLSERGTDGPHRAEHRDRPDRLEVTALAAFLLVHLEWLAEHPAAGDFAEEVAQVTGAVRQAIQPEAAAPAELGPCGRPGCGSPLTAVASRGAPGRVRCAAGHVWEPHEWLRLPHRRRTLPTQLAAVAAGVSEATVRKWASRGKITRYGSPHRAQYDPDEILAATGRTTGPESRRTAG
ncbi:hypothetical protein [Streptomyces sp. NPDC048172]|uniref:hypothetical protein n=1 Tax=Streptomyces sp. NPDC048172 TaxID=3365505 RepID=UPI0037238C0A